MKPTPRPTPPSTAVPVRFQLPYLPAQTVCVAGSFNDWDPGGLPLEAADDTCWTVEVSLPPGVYEYRFVVDGHWLRDPDNPRTVPNPFGEANSVIEVRPAPAPRARRPSPPRHSTRPPRP